MENMLKLRLKKKLNTQAFRLSLAIGSFIGFVVNTYLWFVMGVVSFQWLSVILGLGLLFEGGIHKLFGKRRVKRIEIPKIITLSIGFIVLIGGLLTLPFLIHLLTPQLMGAFGIINVIAIFVIGAEIFFID